MDHQEISSALVQLGYVPLRTVNVLHKEGGKLIPRPLFQPNAIIRIIVESLKPRTDPAYCRNCQRIGHTRSSIAYAPLAAVSNVAMTTHQLVVHCWDQIVASAQTAGDLIYQIIRAVRNFENSVKFLIKERTKLNDVNCNSHCNFRFLPYRRNQNLSWRQCNPSSVGLSCTSSFPTSPQPKMANNSQSSVADISSLTSVLCPLSAQITQMSSRLDNRAPSFLKPYL